MSNLENAKSSVPVSPPPLRTWDFMETMLVGLIAWGVYGLTGGIASAIVLAQYDGTPLPPALFQAYGVDYIAACPSTVAVLWYAIRMAQRDFAEYLSLNWPSSGDLLRALAITVILLLAEILVASIVGTMENSPNPYAAAEQAWGLLIFLIGGCIAAPITEEFVFRGFLFRGWSQSFLGPFGSIVLTSMLWGAMHTQYDWFGRFWIFVGGLVLGYFRWRSNSTWLAVMIHSAMNVIIFFAIGLYP